MSASSISSGGDKLNKNNTQSSMSDDSTANKEGTSEKATSSSTTTSNKAINRPIGAWLSTIEIELYEG